MNPGNIKGNSFGTTTNIISNNAECSDDGTADSARAAYFDDFVTLFGLDAQENTLCAGQGNFDSLSSSYKPNYFFTKSSNQDECMLTTTETKYSIYSTRDYMRCVCDYWDATNVDCLVGIDHEPVGGFAISSIASSAFAAVAAAFFVIF